ncbi:MAG: SurA N-terminal domain-containing protein [Burkholderiaceae bacterium]|nr:SurA N-terminal domain-containing protein [Burkholderiaceae bacterium]
MFDFVRKHTKIMMGLMFLLIIPSFVLFGIDGYTNMRQKGAPVAQVAGLDITQSEWDAAHKDEVDRARESMPTLDVKLLDTPQMRFATLERMVRDRVLLAAAEKLKLVTTDGRLARDLERNPTIASLRLPDGRLDMERYRQLLASQGMSPEMFEARVRADLSTRQVMLGVTGSGFTPAAEADIALNALFQRREIQLAKFNPSDFANRVTISDADLEAFYKRNEALFQAPEQADIEYLVLDLDAIRKTLTLDPQEVKSYYDQNATRLSGQEERRASHILLSAPQTAPAADRQKARAKAEELLAAVRKNPDSFADVARKNSQDTGSASNGGDLGLFARGAMVKPFEDAVFSMKNGEISGIVESDFGYHIIKLTEIKAPKTRSFEEMKDQIEADLKKQQAQRRFAELADSFTNGVYEQSDSLKPVAERLKLDIQKASGIRREPLPGASGVLASPKLLAALFAPDALEKKRNTEAVETGANQLVSARIVKYTPARTLPFADVRDQVKSRLVAQQSAELARKEGEAKLVAWKASPDGAHFSSPQEISREQTQQLPAKVVDAVMKVDATSLPTLVGVDVGAQGFVIARVTKVITPQPPTEAEKRRNLQQYEQLVAAAEAQAYYSLLKEQFKAKILVPKPTPGKDEVDR